MATLTIDRGKSLGSAVGLVLLFSASFAVTLWKVHFAFLPAPVAESGVGSPATPSVIRPVTAGAMTSGALPDADLQETEPEGVPAPSLQELALDKDPAVRDEAQALLGLLDLEPAYD